VPRLRRSDVNGPGIVRRRCGRGFTYQWSTGSKVADREVLDRIAALAIPPAWQEVWICPWPHGHIQAIGTDAAGRRQYRYHDDWRVQRDRAKFERVLDFARALPALREVVARDLAGRGLGQRRVTATGVRLLDIGCFRVGNAEYAEEHETFGIATLHIAHVTVREHALKFEYSAKGSIDRSLTVCDPVVSRAVRSLCRRRAPEDDLLAWKDRDTWVTVGAAGINDYIKAEAGEDFSAKDFRTWAGTVRAAVELAKVHEAGASQRARRRAVVAAVREVADHLGNTPAVCRSSYIDPRVIDCFETGETISAAVRKLGDTSDSYQVQCAVEKAVLNLIGGAGASAVAA
jgi:DNA topoisomerase I